jgi:hypothetical protein
MEVPKMFALSTFLDLAAHHQLGSLLAYIGPGADLSLISSVIGLVLTLGASGVFILMYPFRSLWRRLRGTYKPAEEKSTSNA